MSRTAQLELPLLLPAQAQKHVTVNEALVRLDAAAHLSVKTAALADPPVVESDGASYIVPVSATGEWQSYTGKVAIWSNGGWVYLTPRAGWRAWDEDRAGFHLFDGSVWIAHAIAVSSNGAAVLSHVIEFDHYLNSGVSNSTETGIPANSQVIGVSGRIMDEITGMNLNGWRIGVVGSENRYGSGLGLSQNSYLMGLSGSPVTYYSETPLLISAEGGEFTSGIIRLAIHVTNLAPPRALL